MDIVSGLNSYAFSTTVLNGGELILGRGETASGAVVSGTEISLARAIGSTWRTSPSSRLPRRKAMAAT